MEEQSQALTALQADHRKRAVDTMLLLFAPAMLLMSYLAQLLGADSLAAIYGWNALFVEGLVIFLPAYLFIRRNGGFRAFGFVRVTGREWAFSLLMGVGVFLFVTAINALFVMLWALAGFHQEGTVVATDTPLEVLLSLLFVAVTPAIAEETLFRGALLRSHMPFGVKRAMLHASLLFALAHFQFVSLPALFVAGYIFTYVSRVTGSVLSSMAMHFSYNACAVVLSALARVYLIGQAGSLVPNGMFGGLDGLGGQFAGFEGLSAAFIIIGTLVALAFYAGLGFGVGYPSYRALVRASARRLGVSPEGLRFREVKAAVILCADGGQAQGGIEDEGEGDAQPLPDTPITAPQRGLGWRAALTYVLMCGMSLLFLLITGFS